MNNEINQKIKSKLKQINNEFEDKDYQPILSAMQEKQNRFSIIELIKMLILSLCFKFKQIKKFMQQFGKDQGQRNHFGLTFYSAWISILIYQMMSMKQPKTLYQICFKYINQFMESKKLEQTLQQISKEFNKQILSQQKLKQIIEKINKDNYYQILIKIWENQQKQQLNFIREYKLSKKKELSQMEQDFKDMPDQSIIKVLQNAIINAFKNKFDFIKNGQQFRISVKQIRQALEKNKCLSRQIDKQLSFIQNNEHEHQKNYSILIKIRSELFPIYVPDFKRLIQKNEATEKEVKDKSLILLIGKPGTGKSTIILKCLGYQLIKGSLKYGDTKLPTLIPKGSIKKEHLQIQMSPQQKSITSKFTAVKLPKQFQKGKVQIFVADTPGFQDTRGVQTDLANGIGIIDTIRNCWSIRPVIVISQKSWGDRSEIIKEFGKTIIGLFVDYRQIADSISLVFNKFDNQEIESLSAICKNVESEMNEYEKGNRQLCLFIQNLKKEVENYKQIIKFNPFANQQQLKNKFISKILTKKQIQEPGKQFKYNFAEKTKQGLNLSCQIYKNLIKKKFEQKKYTESLYFLQHLQFLNDKIKDATKVQQNYIQICSQLNQNIKKIKQQISKNLKNQINKKIFNEQVFKEISSEMNLLKQIIIFKKILKVPNQGQISDMLAEVENEFVNKVQTQINQTLFETIKRVKIYSKQFQNIAFQKRIINLLTQRINQTQMNLSKYLKNQEYDNFKILYNQHQSLVRALKILSQSYNGSINIHREIKQIYNKIDELIKSLNNNIEQRKSLIIFDQQTIQKINDTFTLLIKLIELNIPLFQDLQQKKSNLANRLIGLVQKMCHKIDQILDNSQYKDETQIEASTIIKQYRQNIIKSKQIKYIQVYVNRHIERSLIKMQLYMQKCKQTMISAINSLQSIKVQEIQNKIISIYRVINKLEKLSEIQNQQKIKNQVKQMIHIVKKGIQDYILNLFSNQQKPDLSIHPKNTSKYLNLFKKYIHTYNLVYNKKILKNIDLTKIQDTLKKIKQKIIKPISQMLKDVQKFNYQQISNKLQKFNNYANFVSNLNESDSILDFNQQKQKLQNNIKDLCRKIFNGAKEERQELLKKIIQNHSQADQYQADIKKFKQNLKFYNKLIKYQNICMYVFDDSYTEEKVQFQQAIEKIRDLKQEFEKKSTLKYLNNQEILRLKYHCSILRQLDSQLKYNNDEISFKKIYKNLCELASQDFQKCKQIALAQIDQKKFEINFQILINQWNSINYEQNQNKQIFIKQINIKMIKFQNLFINKFNESINQLNENINDQNYKKIYQFFMKANYLIQKINNLKNNYNLNINLLIGQGNISNFQDSIKQIFYQEYQSIRYSILKYRKQGLNQKITKFSLMERAINRSKIQNIKNIIEELKIENDELNQNQLTENQRKKTISQQLQTLLQKKTDQIRKYLISQNSTNIKFDQRLVTIYESIEFKQKQIFKNNLKEYFKNEFTIYQQQSEKSEEYGQQKQNQIRENFQYLPGQLKNQQQKQFKKVIQNVKAQIKHKAQQILKKQSIQINEIIENLIEKRNKKIKKSWEILLNKKLEQLFNKIKNIKDFNEKLKIFKNSFLRLYQIQKSKIQENQQCKFAFITIQAKLMRQWEQQLNKKLKNLEKQIKNENQAKFSMVSENLTNIVKQIMIIGITIKIKQRNLINSENTKQIISKFHSFVNDSIEKYSKIVETFNPDELEFGNFNSTIIQKMKDLVNQITAFKAICKEIKANLDQSIQAQKGFDQKVILEIENLENKEDKLKKLKFNIENMINKVQKFQFFNEEIKNYVPKNFKQHISKLNNQLQKIEGLEKIYQQNLNNQNKFQYKGLISDIQKSINKEVQECLIEINEGCQRYQKPITQRPNSILKMLQALVNERIRGIECNQQIKKIESTIIKNVESLKNGCQIQIQQICKIKQETEKLENIKKNETQIQIKKIKKQIKDNLQNKIKQLIKQTQNNDAERQKKNGEIGEIQKKNKMKIQEAEKDARQNQNIQIKIIKQNNANFVKQNIEKRKELLKSLTQKFVIMKKIQIQLEYQSVDNKIILQKLTNQFQQKLKKKIVKETVPILQQMKKKQKKYQYPQILMSETKIFAFTQAINWIENANCKDINYVLNSINLDGQSKERIKKSYQIYQEYYKKQLREYSIKPCFDTIQQLVFRTINLGKQVGDLYFGKTPPNEGGKEQLLAYIFALWTILKFEKHDDSIEDLYSLHSVQTVALSLILGFNHKLKQQKLANRIVQIGAGQGKSIIVAGLATYFSLVGYQVNCACYSKYLSMRDRQEFQELFEQLSVDSKIKYGTFNEHCWNFLDQVKSERKKIKFGQLIKKGILENQQSLIDGILGYNFLNNNQMQKQKKILIIDQVDTFFDRSFYGNILPSCFSLKGTEVKNLFEMIWNKIKTNKNKNIKTTEIAQSIQFQLLVKKFKPLEEVLKGQINGMVAGALNYKHSYILHDQRIAYNDYDQISTTMNYGYKTVFANCYEYDNKTISRQAYLESLEIGLTAAEFSYALLPNYFDKIVGVTGSLFEMGEFYTKQLMEKYKVLEMYRMPSVYGQNRREQGSMVVPYDKFYSAIVENIKQKIKAQRPIICFFRNIMDIVDFYHSEEFRPFKQNVNTLSEQNDPYTRDLRIKKATKAGQITLMTSTFGRGTNFKIYDKQVVECGGLHIIQCYLSKNLSEQIQIKGRSARQGNKGSYNLLISEKQFQHVGFGVFYEGLILNQHVQSHQKLKMEETVKQIKKDLQLAQKKHIKTVNLFKKQNLTKEMIAKFLNEINKYPEIELNSARVILGIDATGSMSNVLGCLKRVLSQIFDRIDYILKQMSQKSCFQLQIVAYRNWNSKFQQIIKYSDFENKADRLKLFLSKIQAQEGWKEEALEVFYMHVNNQQQVNQIILIGDAPSNSESQTQRKRKRRGQDYWKKNGFPFTTQKIQLTKIIEKGIPIHTFYIKADAYFTEVSKKTNGISQKYNAKADNAAQIMTNFIVENILKKLGEQKYIDEYRRIYRNNEQIMK